jgi:hypothetical protein
MTKSQEIEILKETIVKLGTDSYCGPWLIGQLGAIESAMSSDYSPACYALSPSEALKESMRLIQEAKADAAKIRADSVADGDRERKEAREWRDVVRAQVRASFESILSKI